MLAVMIDYEQNKLFYEMLLPVIDRAIVERRSIDIHSYMTKDVMPHSLYITGNELQDAIEDFVTFQIRDESRIKSKVVLES